MLLHRECERPPPPPLGNALCRQRGLQEGADPTIAPVDERGRPVVPVHGSGPTRPIPWSHRVIRPGRAGGDPRRPRSPRAEGVRIPPRRVAWWVHRPWGPQGQNNGVMGPGHN